MALTLEQAEQLAYEMENYGCEDVEVRPNYSGRFGTACHGLVVPNTSKALIIMGYAAAQLEQTDDDWAVEVDLSDLPTRVDNLGLAYIVY